MTHLLTDVSCASIPPEALPHLAALRTSQKLRVWRRNNRIWLRWPAGDADILNCVLPIQGVEIFTHRDGNWFRPGRRLPVFDIPDDDEAVTLLHLLSPAAFQPESRPTVALQAVPLRLVRDDQPRQTTALECSAAAVLRWADVATTRQLASVEIAGCRDRALLLGDRLPALAGANRFWARGVLLPLGFCCEPQLPESALRDALGLEFDEIAFVREDGADVVARNVFQPASRAGIRRRWGGSAP
jgi:hypothetical protein